jgi:hypothetical protein
MEGLVRLVNESLARHGFETTLDHRRLRWSKWLLCEDAAALVLVPSRPGLFALAEEVLEPGETAATGGKRMLAVFQISESEDLGLTLGRLFLPGNPEREHFAGSRCFARYAVIEDSSQRCAAREALQQWLVSSAEAVSGSAGQIPAAFSIGTSQVAEKEHPAKVESPSPLPAGF